MIRNFTRYAFGEDAKEFQERFGSREAYSRMEESGDRFVLTEKEKAFIESRDSFYLSTVGGNGFPYVQFRGGPRGFLKVLGPSRLGFADYTGNRQFISAGNIRETGKACLFLIDYPTRQRVKILAESEVWVSEDNPELASRLSDPAYPAKVERLMVFDILAYDWNCPKYIPQRYTLDEIRANPDLVAQIVSGV